jgi:regulatory protein
VIITEISPQKNKQDRYNLFVDEEFFCGISSLTLAKENLYKGLEIDNERLEKILFLELENRIFERTAQNITNHPKTEFQVRRYIKDIFFKKKGSWFSKDLDINKEKLEEKIISRLTKYGFINDQAYAKAFVESRIKNKPRGKRVLINELRKKGISKDIAENICNSLVEDEEDLLQKVYAKRYKNEKFSIKDTKKIQYLQRKGFSWDLIKKLITDDTGE